MCGTLGSGFPPSKEKACWNFIVALGKSIPISGLQLPLFVSWVSETQLSLRSTGS